MELDVWVAWAEPGLQTEQCAQTNVLCNGAVGCMQAWGYRADCKGM